MRALVRRTSSLLLLTSALLLLLGGRGWAGTPSSTALAAAGAYSAAHGGAAMLVRQSGKTIFANGTPGEPHRIYSGTKGFWILTALAAQEDGLLKLDDRVSETLPEWKNDERRAAITLRDLLSFTSGLEPRFDLHQNDAADRNRTALGASLVGPRGECFIYGPAALQVFEEVLRRKLAARQQTPIEYLEHRVLRPLGLGPQRYLADKAGQPLLAAGFLLTAVQWSRMGDLILADGRPVLSGHSLEQAFHGSSANRAFGMGFWNNRAAKNPGAREPDIEDILDLKWPQQQWQGVCFCRDAPSDLVASVGSGYQRLYVIPSLQLVVVRFGNFTRFSDAEFLRRLLGK